MQSSNVNKLAASGILLMIAIAVIVWYLNPFASAPGKGRPAEVHYPDGSVEQTTWERVVKRTSSGEAWRDQSPGGGWFYKSSSGQVGRVLNPGDPVPPGYDGKTTAPATPPVD